MIPGIRNLPALFQNFIDDVCDRSSGVDHDTNPGDVFFRRVQSRSELPFAGFPTPLIFRSRGEPSDQGFQIDFEDKNPVEQMNEAREVPGAAAEE